MQVPNELYDTAVDVTARAAPLASYCFKRGLRMKLSEDVPTAYCAPDHLGFNLQFMEARTAEDRLAVMLHEVVHHMFNHCAWLKDRAAAGSIRGLPFVGDYAQCALDCVVNDIVAKYGVAVSADATVHAAIDWRHSEDDAYEIWYKAHPPPPPSGGGGKPGNDSQSQPNKGKGQPQPGSTGADVQPDLGDGEDGGMSEAGAEAIRMGALIQALQESISKCRGTAPGVFEGLLERIRPSKIDWRAHVRKAWRVAAGADQRTWRRPGKAAWATRCMMPGRIGTRTGEIVWQVDTSGSVSDGELQEMFGGMVGCAKQVMPERLTILLVDARVQAVHEISDERQLADLGRTLVGRVKVVGRGGTDMRKGYEWVVENKRKPMLFITSTDGETPWPDHFKPAKQGLVLCTRDTVVPRAMGTTLRVKVEDR